MRKVYEMQEKKRILIAEDESIVEDDCLHDVGAGAFPITSLSQRSRPLPGLSFLCRATTDKAAHSISYAPAGGKPNRSPYTKLRPRR